MDRLTLAYYANNAKSVSSRYNSVESPIAKPLAHYLKKGDRVLDVGAGSGRDVHKFLSLGFEAFGVEPVEALRVSAIEAYPRLKDRLCEGGLPSLSMPFGGQFDAITCSAVLMHIETWDLFDSFLELKKCLKDGGYLIVSISTSRLAPEDAERDEHGRLFKNYSPDYLKLLLGRLGFNEIERQTSHDTLGRENFGWITIVYKLRSATNSRPIDQLEGVLNNDKKDATYKLALVRSLAEIASQNHAAVRWAEGGCVHVPIDLVAEKWIDYYWPLLEAEEFIPQRQGEAPDRSGQIAFRATLSRLIESYRNSGGWPSFRKEAASSLMSEETRRQHLDAKRRILRTIITQPVKYAGGSLATGPVFDYLPKEKAVKLSNDLWIELSLLGHWISESVILRWAEECARMGVKRGVRLHRVVELLVKTEEARRFTNHAREAFAGLTNIECVWTGKLLKERFEIDHLLPYSLWKNNDLWNLLPADPVANNAKRDRLPTQGLLANRRDCIVFYWEYLRSQSPLRFAREAETLCNELADNWQTQMFSKLREAVELTALNRSVPRWEP